MCNKWVKKTKHLTKQAHQGEVFLSETTIKCTKQAHQGEVFLSETTIKWCQQS